MSYSEDSTRIEMKKQEQRPIYARSDDDSEGSSGAFTRWASSEEEAVTPIKPTNPWTFAFSTGLFAGLIWGGVRIAEYYFNFTKVHPTFLIKPWSNPTFNQTTLGYMIGWAAFVLLSILSAFLYMLLFRKVKGHWLGMVYGLAWWAILYLVIGPPMGMMKSIGTIDWNSILTDSSLFLLWGFFIGYTIGFEFTDIQAQEPGTTIEQT